MESYTSFASVYDVFMDNIPYEEWADYVCALFEEYGVPKGKCLELGCGTGTMTELLAERGYDMTGVDISEEMLAIAANKRIASGHHILYLQQDMSELELADEMDCAISVCDSMNYIAEEESLFQVFCRVKEYLRSGGVFIFDLKTEYFYKEILGEQVIAENRDGCSFIWDNYYDEEEHINEYELTFFIKEEETLYRKYEETHFQRAYLPGRVKELIEKSGLTYVTAYDAFTKDAPTDVSERIYIIAKK